MIPGIEQATYDMHNFTDEIDRLTQSLQQSKGVNSIFWGAAYNRDDHILTDAGDHVWSTSMKTGRDTLQKALTLIMSDIPTFLDFAAHGLYSTQVTDPGQLSSFGVSSAFTTYSVSEALKQNKFSASPMLPISQSVFQNGRNCTPTGDVCKSDDLSVYYWSSVTRMQYSISFSGGWTLESGSKTPHLETVMGEATTFSLLQFIEEQTNTYMPVLFDGAYNCTLEGKAGGSSVVFKDDGTLDVACISVVPILLSKGSPCPQGAVLVDGKCPFAYSNWST